MPPQLNIPKYHSKDMVVLLLSMLPTSALLNYLLFDTRYVESTTMLIITTLAGFFYLSFTFVCYGFVAVLLRNRFPSDKEIFKRLFICLGIFYLMSAAFISLLLVVYDSTNFFGYKYRELHFTKAYICAVVVNTFLTFFNEGIYRFENLKATVTQTEKLKKEYMHSRLLGLKSQMNPHFLFNSLNTLSSLIQEDEEKAEDFLNHMSKVYRYLLRNRDETLVSLDTELSFLRSYYFLLSQRHGDGLRITVNVSAETREEMIPPLTLQMIIENAINQNVVSRSKPLVITIEQSNGNLIIQNTLHAKVNAGEPENEVLENIRNKYKLLSNLDVPVEETESERIISIPLLSHANSMTA
jgi:two-component system LytT family sensor kinase